MIIAHVGMVVGVILIFASALTIYTKGKKKITKDHWPENHQFVVREKDVEKRWLKNAWFCLCFTCDDSGIDFEAFKIELMDEEDISKSELHSQPNIAGRCKWDGCINFTQDDHYCSLEYAHQTLLLFKEIYRIHKKNFES